MCSFALTFSTHPSCVLASSSLVGSRLSSSSSIFFFFNDTATTEIYTLSLHDALPISIFAGGAGRARLRRDGNHHSAGGAESRSEEHTSELQSPDHLVCRLLLEKKKRCMVNNHLPPRTIYNACVLVVNQVCAVTHAIFH